MSERRQAGDTGSERAIRVMLVDPHSMVREGLSHILALEPDIAVVAAVGDPQEARLLATNLQPNVVILDADVPDIGEVVARLVAAIPTAGVMILATANDASKAVLVVLAGARGYLSTYATSQDLVRAIRAVEQGELVLEAAALQAVVGRLVHHKPGVAEAADVPYELLSARELEVLDLLCQGRADKEIAQTLYLSVRTVNSHVSHVYAKLGVGTRTEAMHVALQRGLVALTRSSLTEAHSSAY